MWKKIERIDPTILDRISEDDVGMWLAATIQNHPGVHHLSCGVWVRKEGWYDAPRSTYIDVDWGLFAADKVANNHSSIAAAWDELREKLWNDPSRRAAEARRKAQQLLEEAEAIESAAKVK